MLTLQTGGITSEAFRDAFRIGWVADHQAFVSFFGANIMTNSIQIIITVKESSNSRISTGEQPEKS